MAWVARGYPVIGDEPTREAFLAQQRHDVEETARDLFARGYPFTGKDEAAAPLLALAVYKGSPLILVFHGVANELPL